MGETRLHFPDFLCSVAYFLHKSELFVQRENRPFLTPAGNLIPFASDCLCHGHVILFCPMATKVSWGFWEDFLNNVRLIGGNTTILLWMLLVCMQWLALLQPSCDHKGRYH